MLSAVHADVKVEIVIPQAQGQHYATHEAHRAVPGAVTILLDHSFGLILVERCTAIACAQQVVG